MNDCGVRFIIQGLDINTSFEKKFFSNKVFHDKCQTFFILNYQDCRSYQLISNLISNQTNFSDNSKWFIVVWSIIRKLPFLKELQLQKWLELMQQKVKLNINRNHKVLSVFQKTICRILSDWFSNCHGLFPIDRLRLWRQNSNVVQYLDGTCHFYCPFQSMEGLFFHYFYPKSRGRIRFSIVVKLKYFFHKKEYS